MVKLLDGCETVENVVVEVLTIDAITKMTPRPIANHVQDRCLKLDEATAIADDFVRTRGWNSDQPTQLKMG